MTKPAPTETVNRRNTWTARRPQTPFPNPRRAASASKGLGAGDCGSGSSMEVLTLDRGRGSIKAAAPRKIHGRGNTNARPPGYGRVGIGRPEPENQPAGAS